MSSPFLKTGVWVMTGEAAGPYLIAEISSVCTCPGGHSDLERAQLVDGEWKYTDGGPQPSEAHYHLVGWSDRTGRTGQVILAGFRLDGTNVWNDQTLVPLPDKTEPLRPFKEGGRTI